MDRKRWEEVRIEFEYESRSFLAHGHDPTAVDIIVCWEHNWRECPPDIEVIELCSQIQDAEQIDEEVRHDKILTEWQLFAQKHRLEGLKFSEIAQLWREQKKGAADSAKTYRPPGKISQKRVEKNSDEQSGKKKLSRWQLFAQKHRRRGLSMAEIATLWKQQKDHGDQQ